MLNLGSKSLNKFRQVDHRSIEYIIIRNVKYMLKKSNSKKSREFHDFEVNKKDLSRWDPNKLVVGNWFSGTRYY